MKIWADGIIPQYNIRAADSPPRIILDIPVAVAPFESRIIPEKSKHLKGIRIGHHPGHIRVVLDIKGSGMPAFTSSSANRGISVSLRSKRTVSGVTKETNPDPAESRRLEAEQRRSGRLIAATADDGKKDTGYLLAAIQAYKAKEWKSAIKNLEQLIAMSASERYKERSYFLLARSYEKLYSSSPEAYFKDIANHYENAINRYPDSIYSPAALLAIGDLCFKTENYLEAMGYYNLVIKKKTDGLVALHARMQKVKILLLKSRKKEAFAILQRVVSRYPHTPEETEAKIMMAKIAYDMNHFRESLSLLTEVITDRFEAIYDHPDISLYLGYNYYQMGDNDKAKKNLLRFYNSCPDRDINHLVLTNIADAYRDDGLTDDAVKFYQLVLERYPGSEGALISLIRLAEQQEEGKLQPEKNLGPSLKVIGKDIALPKEIYEDVMDHIMNEGKDSPLAELALLKLAMIYQNEGAYEKSLEALQELLKRYPKTSLKTECKHIMGITLNEILKKEMENRRYRAVVNMYLEDKDRFAWINSPDLYLKTARAFLCLDLQDTATCLFKKTEPLLCERERPADLLFQVGSDFLEKDMLDEALSRFDLLITHYPTERTTGLAYYRKGQVLFKQKKYRSAREMFSAALRYPLTRGMRTRVLIDKSRTFIECGSPEEAFSALRKAEKEARNSAPFDSHLYEELGDLYFRAGAPKEAISTFTSAIAMETDKAAVSMLKFKVAECYRSIGVQENSLGVYEQVMDRDEPFWSNLARERIAEIEFHEALKQADSY
ncbi:MAG: tetratricopeptide repeat protein [Thermodesulfobacteriota bacterium]